MDKNVKVIIGANYGDEGKGLLTRFFVKQAEQPVVIFHNGTAQRGHTVDYNPKFRHVYHHFGCGTADGAPTFFAKTFWVHPMEFYREWHELAAQGIRPVCYCDPDALVVTPFDMLIDHISKAYITWEHQEPQHGSCGFGTWCATDRYPNAIFTVKDYLNSLTRETLLKKAWDSCVAQLLIRGVDLDKVPQYQEFFEPKTAEQRKKITITNFNKDLDFFFSKVQLKTFDEVYEEYKDIIFENAQGLGLDKNCGKEWHTTSNTGILNPFEMLSGKEDFNAEVCYVSRSYMTRHGIGYMENETCKREINEDMFDKTNVPNEFQGTLRYGYPEDKEMIKRVENDFKVVSKNIHFTKSLAITHCNEFPNFNEDAAYISNNPYSVLKR